ncbi:uncharacterized protein GIQ15_01870 [Arthroderma uncinatum]|uniref:uncharacterized protein n=1 Tax=Arthroderma uncinatum TaxID=74035 RepID=UPI00144AAB56|nr:uncharacterized protein GIQ15_01870 [Arthroderma uncinatum]KAF3492353.1 hypothetical protein GIQ15_01870 [Arthroderma uncinatum]
MFALPSAKRVCREDLKSPESSRASSPESAAATYAATALERVFASFETFKTSTATEPTTSTDQDNLAEDHHDDEEEEQEFEFRLFSSVPAQEKRPGQTKTKPDDATGTGSLGGVQKLKIRLRSPSPVTGPRGDGGFIVPFRGWDYYFSNPELVMRAVGDTTSQKEKQSSELDRQLEMLKETFQDAAMDGNTILARAVSGTWPGCHLPWRVVHLPAPRVKSTSNNTASTSKSKTPLSKRKKPGKKRRIALRKNVTSKQAAEEAEKEKRNRKNRERKIKRRQKERDKKAAARAAAGDAASTADADESS